MGTRANAIVGENMPAGVCMKEGHKIVGERGELLLDKQGRVVHVWTTKDVKFNRPFPAFTQAIVEAILQWQYEPLLVKKTSAPACVTVTMSISWS